MFCRSLLSIPVQNRNWVGYEKHGFSTGFPAPLTSTSFWFPNQPPIGRVRQRPIQGSSNVPVFCITGKACPGHSCWSCIGRPSPIVGFLQQLGSAALVLIKHQPKEGWDHRTTSELGRGAPLQMVFPPEKLLSALQLSLSAVLLL